MNIAFLGLGGMGRPMAENLLKAGHSVAVWNRSPQPVQALAEKGARACNSPADIGDTQVLISMLADDAITEDVVVKGGTLDALAPGSVWINMATVSVAFTQAMVMEAEQRQLRYVAAPVLGRTDVAAAGALTILTAGDGTLLDHVQPLFEALGQKTWRFGDAPEQAVAVKLGANFMLASAIEAMGESSALVEAFGVDKKHFLSMLTSTLFSAPAYKGYGAMIAEDSYSPAGFSMTLGFKDVRLVQAAAEGQRVPMGFAGVLRDNYLDALAHGDEALDWSALAKVSARRSGQR